ncbi:DEAD/DEAH box helicase, partial [Candidatus Zixiibacteriota bacterium]
MKLEALTAYGILPAFIECWRETIGEQLLDWQADALNHYGLLDRPAQRRNLLVVAPTSSGKTFIGELAAAAALSARKKVIFIVPLKAIAGEKFQHFTNTFGKLGFQSIISTRDHRHFDRAFSAGKFDLAVVVAEKLRHLLIKNIDLLERVDLIVADELHLLSDP